MRRSALTVLVALLAISMAFAGGSSEKNAESDQRVVTTVCRASYANEVWYNEMNKAFEEETGIHVVVQPTPGNDADHDAKVNIDLTAGSTIDVIPSLGPRYYAARVEAGFFVPLRELVEGEGINAEEKFGANLPVEEDGDYYSLPSKIEAYCVFYNKDLFDKAGVPYPSTTEPWTWEDYQEIAIALSDADAGVYGSFMNAENPWIIISSVQKEDPFYTEDGTCNFDTPVRREAIEWFYDMTHELGCQMPVSEIMNENVSWNYYAMAGDHLAMFSQGNWFTRLLNSQADYPRDWKYGIARTPAPEGYDNNIVSAAYNSINVNAEHPEEALEYVIWLSENQWKFEGGIPAYAEMTEEDREIAFGSIAEASDGQITVDDLYNCLVNNGMGAVQSDIIGVAADEYNRIANEELQAYFLDLQDLDTAMANITRRVNEAIASYM